MNTIFNDIPERNITSIFPKIMNTVETLFGKKNPEFDFVGILLNDDAPCLYFPLEYAERKVEIRITNDCEYNLVKAVFQVSHECVHLLYPNLWGSSTYLEEGIATFFSHWYTNKHYGPIRISNKKYLVAANMAMALFQRFPNLIKELRGMEPNIARITKDMILAFSPAPIDESLAGALATNFQSELPEELLSKWLSFSVQ